MQRPAITLRSLGDIARYLDMSESAVRAAVEKRQDFRDFPVRLSNGRWSAWSWQLDQWLLRNRQGQMPEAIRTGIAIIRACSKDHDPTDLLMLTGLLKYHEADAVIVALGILFNAANPHMDDDWFNEMIGKTLNAEYGEGEAGDSGTPDEPA